MWLAHPSGSVAAQTSHHLAEIANRSKGHHLQIGYSQTGLFRPVAVALQRSRPPAESIDQRVHPAAAAAVGVAAAGAVAHQRAHYLLYSAEHHQKDCRQGSVARSGRLQTYYFRVAMAGKVSRAVFQRLGSAAAGPQKANRRSLAVGAAAQLIAQRCRLVAGAAGQLSDQKCFLVAGAAERQKASRRRPVAGHCYQMESFAVGVVAQFAVQRCSLVAAAGAAGQLADRRCCFVAAVGAAVAAVQTSQKKT